MYDKSSNYISKTYLSSLEFSFPEDLIEIIFFQIISISRLHAKGA